MVVKSSVNIPFDLFKSFLSNVVLPPFEAEIMVIVHGLSNGINVFVSYLAIATFEVKLVFSLYFKTFKSFQYVRASDIVL